MIVALNILLWLIAAVLLVPVVIVCAEVLAALLPQLKRKPDAASPRPRIGIVIPAHNESAVIARTLTSIKPQLMAGDRLVVVADNCTDDTANIARSFNAEVIERRDDVNRGKGYALDFGVKHLAATGEPDVGVILDADVTLRDGAIDKLIRQADRTGCPAQGVYLLSEPPSASGKDIVSHLAFVVRNHVRPLGLARLGGPCPLFGAGMAFPWKILKTAPLATGNIVEDISLALDLAVEGRAPRLCPDAYIDGQLPKSDNAASKQRRRWEHGHLRTILTQVPRTLIGGLVRGRPGAMLLALDILVPPLSLLIFLILVAIVVAWLLALVVHTSIWPATVLSAGLLSLVVVLVLAWTRFSPHDRSILPLLSAPGYMLRKLPMYFAFFTRGGEKTWVRTDRDTPGK
jgi:cellulose synthase/poly-beta-1,6-N-acetylglucosamine synthase-like glycosyltransferase